MTLTSLLDELRRTRDETLKCYALGADDLERTYGPGKWSVRYILLHLADSETVFYERIRRVICEPELKVWFYDQDRWAATLDYSQVPLELSRSLYEPSRAANMYYAGRFYESHGHVKFTHSTAGLRTLKDEFDKVAEHNEHHLSQIRTALRR